MSGFRIPSREGNPFNGHQIAERQPLQFRLNGRRISGFAGDSVLTALLASGVDCAGTHQGFPIALDAHLDLFVRLADAPDDLSSALPMARTPAVDGADFKIFRQTEKPGLWHWLKQVRQRDTHSLRLDFDAPLLSPAPGDAPLEAHKGADFVVVGGGIAGLSAAAHAAAAGQSVILIERRAYLGGDAVLFGHAAGEEPPDNAIARLSRLIADAGNVTVLTSANAVAVTGNTVRVHQVVMRDGRPVARQLHLRAEHIVLATGTADRLPLFPGNRLPGVTSLSSAFHRASAYGIWPGVPSVIALNGNAGYRLALLAQDAGLDIGKVMDARLEPQSRFAEFTKAYGIKSEAGLRPQSVQLNANTGGLFVKMELSWEGGRGDFEPLQAGAMIASGGWMPRLALWQMAGGGLQVDADGRIRAEGTLGSVALAGSCANYASNTAILRSGTNAVDHLLGRTVSPIEDKVIDPAFESPDGDFPVSQLPETNTLAPRYFDTGKTLVSAPRPVQGGMFTRASHAHPGPVMIADTALSLGDVATLTAIGEVLPQAFTTIVEERVVPPTRFTAPARPAADSAQPPQDAGIPAYLSHRFGADAQLWEIDGEDGRAFQTGNLLYANSDTHDPMEALGVIISVTHGNNRNALALLAAGQAGHQIMVRSQRGHTSARIIRAVTPD